MHPRRPRRVGGRRDLGFELGRIGAPIAKLGERLLEAAAARRQLRRRAGVFRASRCSTAIRSSICSSRSGSALMARARVPARKARPPAAVAPRRAGPPPRRARDRARQGVQALGRARHDVEHRPVAGVERRLGVGGGASQALAWRRISRSRSSSSLSPSRGAVRASSCNWNASSSRGPRGVGAGLSCREPLLELDERAVARRHRRGQLVEVAGRVKVQAAVSARSSVWCSCWP